MEMWLPDEPRCDKLINRLQDNENELHMMQAKSLQEQQYAFQVRHHEPKGFPEQVKEMSPPQKRLHELDIHEIERLAPATP